MARPKKKTNPDKIDVNKLSELFDSVMAGETKTTTLPSAKREWSEKEKRALNKALEKYKQTRGHIANRLATDGERQEGSELDNAISMAALLLGMGVDLSQTMSRGEHNELESQFDNSQIEVLADLFNSHIFLTDKLSTAEVRNMFFNPRDARKRLKISNTRLMVYLFSSLCESGWICPNWQAIVDRCGLFVGRSGKFVTNKMMSSAKNAMESYNASGRPRGYAEVDACIEMLKKKNESY